MKQLTTILICTIAIVFASLNTASAFVFGQNIIKDIDEHWAQESITTLKNMGVMNGYDGYSNPDDMITRGEFTALITRAFEIKPGNISKEFKDIGKEHIFYDAIKAASGMGIINGFDDDTFRADNPITREEIMLIISRLTDNKANSKAQFNDIPDNYKYLGELSKVSEDGIVNGYSDKTFRPYNKTTRAEAGSMIIASVKKYMPESDLESVFNFAYSYLGKHFSDINSAAKDAIGTALSDTEYIKNTYNVSANNGYTVSNSIHDISFLSSDQNGPFTDFAIEYNVTRSINGNTKTYKGQSKISIITRNGVNKVYNHLTRIIYPEFINLTWEVFSNPPSYDTKGVNVVSPTSFRIEKDKGSNAKVINTGSQNLYFNSNLTDEYLSYARKNGYDVWVMYKTDFKLDTASMFLNSSEARKQANDILIGQILKNNLDGINFDFENMYRNDKGAYTNHVKEISIMAHTLGATVSVDITKYEPTSSTWSMCYDRDALNDYADYIMLMAYDQYYSSSKTPGPVSGLDWTESCIKLTLKEVSNDKLVLGMPYYIRIWKTQNGKALSSSAVSMSQALEKIELNNAVSEYDPKFKLTKYFWTQDEYVYMLWMEDAVSIKERVKLSKKYSLSGVASWRRGFETDDVWQSIIDGINEG